MTVIAAAFRNDDDYAIASDSTSEIEGSRVPSGAKVWRWGSVLLGSHGLMVQRRRAMAWMSERTPPVTVEALEADLVELHDHLAAKTGAPGYAEVPLSGVGILTVGPWGIVDMDSGGALARLPHWWAGGSGGPVARGAMLALTNVLDAYAPRQLVAAGVDAAIALDTGCGGAAVVLRGGA